MSKLLYIEASPTKGRSNTIAVAETFLEAYRAAHPDDEIERLDLWKTVLPPFDGDTIDAKFAVLRTKQFTPAQFERWDAVRRVSRHFNSADKYVFSVPMWNFGVPYIFKHYIDVVTLPGENWTWSRAAGYGTILSGKKALAIYSSASPHIEVGEGADDFHRPFIRQWLRFIGVKDIHEIAVAPTLSDPETLAKLKADALAAATELARRF